LNNVDWIAGDVPPSALDCMQAADAWVRSWCDHP